MIQSLAESVTPPKGMLIPVPLVVPSNGVAQGDEGLRTVGLTNSCMTALIDRVALITSAAVIDMIIDAASRAEAL